MLKLIQSHTALILSTVLALTGVSCSVNKPNSSDTQPVATKMPISKPAAKRTTPKAIAKPKKTAPSTQPNSYPLALDKASSASIISQSAQSPDDWNAVVGQWNDALALMKAVPASSPYTTVARTKIAEYQRNLDYAKQQAHSTGGDQSNVVAAVPAPAPDPITPSPTADVPQPTLSQGVFQVPIKRRAGGTPVVDVTFNSTRQFEMIVDTGASGTVITQQMADTLRVVPVGKAKANTASAKAVEFSIAYVESIEIGGAVVKNIPVAIAGPELETGLLGHDFLDNYDVTIKRDVVEFRPR